LSQALPIDFCNSRETRARPERKLLTRDGAFHVLSLAARRNRSGRERCSTEEVIFSLAPRRRRLHRPEISSQRLRAATQEANSNTSWTPCCRDPVHLGGPKNFSLVDSAGFTRGPRCAARANGIDSRKNQGAFERLEILPGRVPGEPGDVSDASLSGVGNRPFHHTPFSPVPKVVLTDLSLRFPTVATVRAGSAFYAKPVRR
jgi:hypothetical protein